MDYRSLNPATGHVIAGFPAWDDARLARELEILAEPRLTWRAASVAERCEVLHHAARLLRAEMAWHGALITEEMGKPIGEAWAEVEKSARGCDFFAAQAPAWLADEAVITEARRSLVACQPLGTILAIMPWNFPYWQVFRATVPALAAGNGVLLKHAPNVPRCAEAMENLWLRAGLPAGVFRWLPISHGQAERLIGTDAVQGVTLTGSERAGRRIGAVAGAALKKTVLELGGSDPFVVLEDADLDRCVEAAVEARFQNCGQSCIAAKRFIVVDDVAEGFLSRFEARIRSLTVGDPTAESTRIGPLARADLRETLHVQVTESVRQGALLRLGGQALERPGFYYAPTVLEGIRPGVPAHDQETFGPLAAVLRVPDEAAALAAANRTGYGLGGSVWTCDPERGEHFIRRVNAGLGFVNALVRSDPRLPFGGVGRSGHGRELGRLGLREFVNHRTLWVD